MPAPLLRPPRRLVPAIAMIAMAAALHAPSAQADMNWQWQYAGENISASGTFATHDTPDAEGFYEITGITGQRNGDAITGLYPTGQAIPGNAPYALDNLVRLGPQGQLTVHGFGFTTASGGYANPFFADFLDPAGYLEVFTTASSYAELPITFSATPVPEAGSLLLALGGLGVMGGVARLRRRAGSPALRPPAGGAGGSGPCRPARPAAAS